MLAGLFQISARHCRCRSRGPAGGGVERDQAGQPARGLPDHAAGELDGDGQDDVRAAGHLLHGSEHAPGRRRRRPARGRGRGHRSWHRHDLLRYVYAYLLLNVQASYCWNHWER